MSQLVDDSLDFVTGLFASSLPSTCLYHNLTHTKRVLKSTKEIIVNSNLNDEEIEVLELAAILHDTGYIKGSLEHEIVSVDIATKFLREHAVNEDLIKQVTSCILATKLDAEPTTTLEKIIRDADASHFAKYYFQEASELLRLELKLQGIQDYSRKDWLEGNINMLQTQHKYYSDYAIEHWNPKKEENLVLTIKEKKTLKKEDEKELKEMKKILKNEDPEKAIQSVFRITLKNHIKLSDIADTKANILLSVNAIIISIALSNLIPKLDNASNAYLITPTIVFLLFTIVSIVLSIIATRPNVTSGKFTKEDVKNKQVNLLFFGNFHKMTLQEYQWAMTEMLNDKDYIYSSMTKDLYFLGLVLQRKYSILRLTYTIFMTGIILSVIAFAVAFKMDGH
ncbi:MAG: putative metal-dependent HD superfamily phosphohydrolase [Ulvibacter sp.]|jgi:predicted metal-dependent HD superfamily phosphohydrolase